MAKNIERLFLTQNQIQAENDNFKEFLSLVRNVDVEILSHGFGSHQKALPLKNFMLPNFLILYCLQGQGSIKQGNREAWFVVCNPSIGQLNI